MKPSPDSPGTMACFDGEAGPEPAEEAVFFTIGSLRQSVGRSKLGPPKSASEGAERDRTWPATVPSRPGVVREITDDKLKVEMHGDGNVSRRQTYSLRGNKVYVSVGDTFRAGESILAGAPESLADLGLYLGRSYSPLQDLKAVNDVDRYAAVKSLPRRADLHGAAVSALEYLLGNEAEERVALEAAGSAAALGSQIGEDRIAELLRSEGRADMRMEAVLILTELSNPFAHRELVRIAGAQELVGSEIRQAAVWGLGKAGLGAYADIIPFLDDEDENVALHAIVAFGKNAPKAVIDQLVAELVAGHPRRAPAASEALRIIGNTEVMETLITAAQGAQGSREWALATLGRMSPDAVRARLAGEPLLGELAPLLLVAEGASWLSTEEMTADISFLHKQDI